MTLRERAEQARLEAEKAHRSSAARHWFKVFGRTSWSDWTITYEDKSYVTLEITVDGLTFQWRKQRSAPDDFCMSPLWIKGTGKSFSSLERLAVILRELEAEKLKQPPVKVKPRLGLRWFR